MSLIAKQEKHGTESGRPKWNDTVRYGNQRRMRANLKWKARKTARAKLKQSLSKFNAQLV